MSARRPAGLGRRGSRFWRTVVAKYELSPAEIELLVEVCRALDAVEALEAAVKEKGATVAGSRGQPRVNPALAELRQQRTALSRLLALLGLPDEHPLPSPATLRARKAAESRWVGHVKRDRRSTA